MHQSQKLGLPAEVLGQESQRIHTLGWFSGNYEHSCWSCCSLQELPFDQVFEDLRLEAVHSHQSVTSLEDMQHADVDAAPGNGGSPDLFGCARPQFPSKLARWATGSRPRYRRGMYAVELIPMKAWKRLITA